MTASRRCSTQLTRRGLELAQGRQPAPAISAKREWRTIEQRNAGRLGHDLHALAWAIELHRTVGDDRHRPLAHPPLRHRPLSRPPGRVGPRPTPDHPQRDPRPRGTGDHRRRAEDVQRGQAGRVARAANRNAEADLRPTLRAGPYRQALHTTVRSSSRMTPSSAAGVWPIPATEPRAPGPSWFSYAQTPMRRWPARGRQTPRSPAGSE